MVSGLDRASVEHVSSPGPVNLAFGSRTGLLEALYRERFTSIIDVKRAEFGRGKGKGGGGGDGCSEAQGWISST